MNTDEFILSSSDALNRLATARDALGGIRFTRGRPRGRSMFDPDVISFAHGEGMRRPHPLAIVSGLHALLDTEESTLEDYFFLRQCTSLENAARRSMLEEGADPNHVDNIVVEAGSTRIAFGAIFSFAQKGDTVLTAPGFYHPLGGWVGLCKLNLGVAANDDENPGVLTRHSLESWNSQIGAGKVGTPRIIMLFNPTMLGTIYRCSDLEAVGDWADRWGSIVIEDRVFARTIYPNKQDRRPPTFSSVASQIPSICVHGVTKSECLANVRLGWACGHASIIDKLRTFSVATSASVPEVSKLIAAGALNAPAKFVIDNAKEAHMRCKLVYELINSMPAEEGLLLRELAMPVAGHSIYFQVVSTGRRSKCSDSKRDSIRLCEYLLDNWGVAVSPGYSAGFDGPIFRLSFACVGHREVCRASSRRELDATERYLRWRRTHTISLRDLSGWFDSDDDAEACDEWRTEGRRVIVDGISGRLKAGLSAAYYELEQGQVS